MNQDQILLLKKIGIKYESDKTLTGAERAEIEDKVGDYLTLHCLDDSYKPNEEGRMCESILDTIDTL